MIWQTHVGITALPNKHTRSGRTATLTYLAHCLSPDNITYLISPPVRQQAAAQDFLKYFCIQQKACKPVMVYFFLPRISTVLSESVKALHIQRLPWQGVPKPLLKRPPSWVTSPAHYLQWRAEYLPRLSELPLVCLETEARELSFSLGGIPLLVITDTFPRAQHGIWSSD